MNKLFAAVSFAAAFSLVVSPVFAAKRKCYECGDTPKCEAEFNKTNTNTFKETECDKEDSKCYKLEYEEGGKTMVMKGCAPDTLPEGAKAGKCKDDVTVSSKKGTYCVCDGDNLCNGANGNNLAAIGIVLVALAANIFNQ